MVALQACWRTHGRTPAFEDGAGGTEGGAGGTGGAGGAGGAGGETEAPADPQAVPDPCVELRYSPRPTAAAVDIIWAVDSSRSMMDERARIAQTINRFVENLQTRVSDVRVVMVTDTNIVPAPLGTDAERFLFVPRYVDSTEPLAALLEHLPDYRGFLRPEAAPHIVVVSDDDSALSADVFLAQMAAEIGPFTFHAIASPEVDGGPCRDSVPSEACLMFGEMYPALCGGAAPGLEYYALAEATGGQRISICDSDWAAVFSLLSDAVLEPTPVPCTLALGVRADGVPHATVGLRLVPDADTPAPIELAAASDCGPGITGFYRLSDEVPQVSLCPETCAALTDSAGDLLLRLDCEP